MTSAYIVTLVEHHGDTSVTQQVWTVGAHFAMKGWSAECPVHGSKVGAR